jgi:hypothetical protein
METKLYKKSTIQQGVVGNSVTIKEVDKSNSILSGMQVFSL